MTSRNPTDESLSGGDETRIGAGPTFKDYAKHLVYLLPYLRDPHEDEEDLFIFNCLVNCRGVDVLFSFYYQMPTRHLICWNIETMTVIQPTSVSTLRSVMQ